MIKVEFYQWFRTRQDDKDFKYMCLWISEDTYSELLNDSSVDGLRVLERKEA